MKIQNASDKILTSKKQEFVFKTTHANFSFSESLYQLGVLIMSVPSLNGLPCSKDHLSSRFPTQSPRTVILRVSQSKKEKADLT